MAARSLKFQARNQKFFMELNLDHPQPKSEKNGRQKTKWPPKNKMAAINCILNCTV